MEEENYKLKQLVADLSLDKAMLQDVLKKKALKPVVKRELVQHLQQAWNVGLSRACRVINIERTVYRYQSKRYDHAPLRTRIKEIAYTRVRYGCKRIYILLRREGWVVNHKRVYRLYCLDQLNLRYRKPRRHKSSSAHIKRLPVQHINQCWSMDFLCDQLFNGQRLRFLTVVDIF